MTYGTAIDCVGHPSGADVRAAGHRAVALYVGNPGRAKDPTRTIVADLLGNGRELVLVFEDTTGSWRGGRVRGHNDATAVLAHLQVLGLDLTAVGCVYHAFDSDVTTADLPIAREYVAGVAEVYGSPVRVGAYGGHVVCTDLLDRGLIGWAWASAGWQYGHTDPRCALIQQLNTVTVGGVQCDIDVVVRPNFGQYPSPFQGATPLAPSAPAAAPDHSSEAAVSLLEFSATLLPAAPPGGRWQDVPAAAWPRSAEEKSALVPALASGGGWRGRGSISAIVCGWAANQDGPTSSGAMKSSGFIEYLRIFGFSDQGYTQWEAHEVLTNVALIGNRSLPAISLPDWCTNFAIRYSAPGGLYLGVEYER